MRRDKLGFTLLELLLVIALITIGIGTLALQLPKILKGEQFEQNIETLVAKLTMAQELMISRECDVRVSLSRAGEHFFIYLYPSQLISEKEKKNLNRRNELKNIEEIRFNGKAYRTLDLFFDATLDRYPKGILQLQAAKKNGSLVLKGFPAPIKRGNKTHEEEKEIYPEEILRPF